MRFLYRDTPLKIDMELKYHPIEKENRLPSTSMTLGSKAVIFPGYKTSFLGRLVSFWDGFLADAMLVSGRVSYKLKSTFHCPCLSIHGLLPRSSSAHAGISIDFRVAISRPVRPPMVLVQLLENSTQNTL